MVPADRDHIGDFETSAQSRLIEPGAAPIGVGLRLGGIFDLTLHTPNDKDVFRIEPVATNPLSVPMVSISLTDLPLDITLFDAARTIIATRVVGKQTVKLPLPRAEVSFIEISGARATRYRLTLRLEVDPAHLPGPIQEQVVVPLPNLSDPAFRVDHEMNHALFQVDASQTAGVLTLAAIEGQPLKVELLDATGAVVRTAQRREDSLQESVELDITGLQPGGHVLRMGHEDEQSSLSATPLNVQVLPSWA